MISEQLFYFAACQYQLLTSTLRHQSWLWQDCLFRQQWTVDHFCRCCRIMNGTVKWEIIRWV